MFCHIGCKLLPELQGDDLENTGCSRKAWSCPAWVLCSGECSRIPCPGRNLVVLWMRLFISMISGREE